MNIHNDTAYANSSTRPAPMDTPDVEQSDWYLEVSAEIYLYFPTQLRHSTFL